MHFLRNILNSFIEIFYPRCCYGCEDILLENENYLCSNCRHNLPITNYHLENNNDIKKLFFGKVDLIYSVAFLDYSKGGIVQSMIHKLKYKGNQEIGTFIGKWYGNLLLDEMPSIKDIDIIIPVPMHKKKLRQRGYNQVDTFGKELANIFKIEYNKDILIRTKYNKSQTTKNRKQREKNIRGAFEINNIDKAVGKHIAIVDDVITTGATLENCCKIINKIPNTKVSIIIISKGV